MAKDLTRTPSVLVDYVEALEGQVNQLRREAAMLAQSPQASTPLIVAVRAKDTARLANDIACMAAYLEGSA